MRKLIFALGTFFLLGACTTAPSESAVNTGAAQAPTANEESTDDQVEESSTSAQPAIQVPEEFQIPRDLSGYRGTYLEEGYLQEFASSYNHIQALVAGEGLDVLVIGPNFAISSILFGDQYGITASDFEPYELRMEEETPVILDPKGNRYQRISLEYAAYTREVAAHLVSEISKVLPELETPEPGYVSVDGTPYRVILNRRAYGDGHSLLIYDHVSGNLFNLTPTPDGALLEQVDS